MSETLTVHDLTFEIRRSNKRKSIGITIDRRGELILAAPAECPNDVVQRTAEEKYRWIYTKLAKKEMLFRPPRPKEFLTGEIFSYLGHPFRLQVLSTTHRDSSTLPLRFAGGWFFLREDERARGQEHFIRWYSESGLHWLEEQVTRFARHVGVKPQGVGIKDLGYRWGSCNSSKVLNFHWRVIQLPPSIIDYIVVHELVHLEEPRHNAAFWRRVEQAMPDYDMRKQWLIENGSKF